MKKEKKKQYSLSQNEKESKTPEIKKEKFDNCPFCGYGFVVDPEADLSQEIWGVYCPTCGLFKISPAMYKYVLSTDFLADEDSPSFIFSGIAREYHEWNMGAFKKDGIDILFQTRKLDREEIRRIISQFGEILTLKDKQDLDKILLSIDIPKGDSPEQKDKILYWLGKLSHRDKSLTVYVDFFKDYPIGYCNRHLDFRYILERMCQDGYIKLIENSPQDSLRPASNFGLYEILKAGWDRIKQLEKTIMPPWERIKKIERKDKTSRSTKRMNGLGEERGIDAIEWELPPKTFFLLEKANLEKPQLAIIWKGRKKYLRLSPQRHGLVNAFCQLSDKHENSISTKDLRVYVTTNAQIKKWGFNKVIKEINVSLIKELKIWFEDDPAFRSLGKKFIGFSPKEEGYITLIPFLTEETLENGREEALQKEYSSDDIEEDKLSRRKKTTIPYKDIKKEFLIKIEKY